MAGLPIDNPGFGCSAPRAVQDHAAVGGVYLHPFRRYITLGWYGMSDGRLYGLVEYSKEHLWGST